jgi:WD40 repeat protein
LLRPLAIFGGHGARVAKVVFSEESGKSLMTASQDGWVRAWTIGAGAGSKSFEIVTNSERGQDGVLVSGDGKAVFAYDSDGHWHAWHMDNGQPLDIPENVVVVASGDRDRDSILFETPTSHFSLGAAPPTKNKDAFGLELSSWWKGPVSADGSRAVSDESDLAAKPADDSRMPALSDDQSHPAVLFETETKKVLSHLSADGRNAGDFFFSPDGSRLFGRLEPAIKDIDESRGAGLAVWDARSGKLLGFVAAIEGYERSEPTSASRNGARILAGGKGLFDVDDSGFKAVDIPAVVSSSQGSTRPTILSADGASIAVGREDGTIVIADIAENTLRRILDTNGRPIRILSRSEDGHYLAATDSSNAVWIFNDAGDLVRTETFRNDISSTVFLAGFNRLAVLEPNALTILPTLTSFGGFSDTSQMVDAAGRQGLNLVSDEEFRRYRFGTDTNDDKPICRKWAALDPNSEGTSQVVCGDSKTAAVANALANCKQTGSTTCASRPADTSDLSDTFVFYCCTEPKLGCAVSGGSGAQVLMSVKSTLADAKYSSCAVRGAFSARDGSRR